MPETVRARLFQGTRDVLPDELLPRQEVLDSLRRTFERFGFGPLETPAFEYLDILLGKYGAEGEKLIYKLAYRDGETLALRYDLTVPLSRVVAMNRDLPLPFKRYQVQPVWRADRAQPAQGRFREFIQCDVDTVGTASLVADAENVAVVHDGVAGLGIPDFLVRINHRRLLRGMIRHAGLPDAAEGPVLRAADKRDKIGREGVEKELSETDLPRAGWGAVLDLMDLEGERDAVLTELEERFGEEEAGREGVLELRELFAHVEAMGVATDRVALDLHLTRGLDYYTGPVYEVTLEGGALERFGSLGGGGRYDDLMGLYGGASLPATGVSIGLSRVQAALDKLDLLRRRVSPTQVLIARLGDAPVDRLLGLVGELRGAGLCAELYYDSDRLKKQFQHAERKEIPLVVLAGSRELEEGRVEVKVLARGEQVAVPRGELVPRIRELLAGAEGAPEA